MQETSWHNGHRAERDGGQFSVSKKDQSPTLSLPSSPVWNQENPGHDFCKSCCEPFVVNTYRFCSCETLGIASFLLHKFYSSSFHFSTQKRLIKMEKGLPYMLFSRTKEPWVSPFANHSSNMIFKCKNSSLCFIFSCDVLLYSLDIHFALMPFKKTEKTVCTKHCLSFWKPNTFD